MIFNTSKTVYVKASTKPDVDLIHKEAIILYPNYIVGFIAFLITRYSLLIELIIRVRSGSHSPILSRFNFLVKEGFKSSLLNTPKIKMETVFSIIVIVQLLNIPRFRTVRYNIVHPNVITSRVKSSKSFLLFTYFLLHIYCRTHWTDYGLINIICIKIVSLKLLVAFVINREITFV